MNGFVLRTNSSSIPGLSDFVFRVEDGSLNHGAAVSSGPAPKLNMWNHVVGTYDSSSLRLYFNGALVREIEWSGAPC